MLYFLRTKSNKDLVEIDLNISRADNGEKYIDVRSGTNIQNYSIFLLDLYESSNKDTKIICEFIRNIESIDQLRGWLWEIYFAGRKNESVYYDDVREKVKESLKSIAQKFNLVVVED